MRLITNFSAATILYCVGTMANLGSINRIGVIFSAFSVFLYQGIFYLFASQIKDYLSSQAISEVNAVGGVLVLAIGIN